MQQSTNTKHKKIDTLKNSYEFDIVFKNGLRFNRDFMAIYAMPLRDFIFHLRKKKQYNRFIESKMLLGFSINKKVAKACKRNLIRRRIKAQNTGDMPLFLYVEKVLVTMILSR